MKTIMVQYKTTEAHANANEALVRAVFAELAASGPPGIRYASYRLADGLTFLHIASIDTRDENPLLELGSFKSFQKELRARCAEPPVITEVAAIGAYAPAAVG